MNGSLRSQIEAKATIAHIVVEKERVLKTP
jgi:hypothetical protein